MFGISTWPHSSDEYQLENAIGQGKTGTVYSAVTLSGPHQHAKVAVKVVDIHRYSSSTIEKVLREMQARRIYSHPNILSYHTAFISGNFLWIVMPLLSGGSLESALREKYPEGIKDQVLVASIMKGIVQGLQCFHRNHLIHKNLKAGNVLFDGEGNLYLSDFGVSSVFNEDPNIQLGCPCWFAPEVILNENVLSYDYKADIWSLGITALEMVRGKPPYMEYPNIKIRTMITNKDPPFLTRLDKFDSSFKEVVNMCLNKEPSRRPSTDNLIRKKFFGLARDSEYIKNNLLKDIFPIEYRVSQTSQYQRCIAKRNSTMYTSQPKPQGEDPNEMINPNEDE